MKAPTLDHLRLAPASPSVPAAQRRPHRIHGPFLRGPIPWEWLVHAARLPGKAFQIGILIWRAVGFGDKMTVNISLTKAAAEMGFDRSSATRGLAALERAKLVSVARQAGCKPTITVLEVDAGSRWPETPRGG